ncbi:Hypothetical_protein [Hexamita inflata]|uniref:Hypothetical_protein n=1 Tax=Hexamita inflata TaxID=28002 RepID=A0AA86NEF4_9EUKA|nr:Hypothetical protein HINF_LOCUS5679 [Hexamita inflata]CAI9923042.1 Hypothetical protein HINF_LOCUS10687 [Hexamita inflata]CAI9928388.1 Hypothetical protein HINF_LOCUS16033 [Hexamita inflata]CAI9942794.1 Hypothetical protein HINF_LOCUS30439 [Hexamita inflata]
MAFNPFAAKPQVDHSKIIRHFNIDFRDIKESKDSIAADMEDFMKEIMEAKKNLTEMMADTTQKINRRVIQDYSIFAEEIRGNYEEFKQDIEQFQVGVDETIKKVGPSVEKMTKEEARKYQALTEMVGTGKKFLKRMEGIHGEIVAVEKKLATIEAGVAK